jgi:hypothetical protein
MLSIANLATDRGETEGNIYGGGLLENSTSLDLTVY